MGNRRELKGLELSHLDTALDLDPAIYGGEELTLPLQGGGGTAVPGPPQPATILNLPVNILHGLDLE